MKNLKMISLAMLVAVLSCSKDDDKSDANVPNGINRAPNLQVTGSSANDFLAASKYNALTVEVLYVAGYQPNPQTLTNLQNFLEARLNKPGGITIASREMASPGTAPFDINEIVAIESSTRTKYNNLNTLAMYIVFVDGGTTTDTDSSFILGTAYRNTSCVVYESSIQNLSNSLTEPNRVDLESTVLLHEMGHLLGLVNLGSPMQNEHLDEAHGKHCDNDHCLMYWETENSGVLGMMLGGNVPQLDANCIADLRANGGK